MTTVQTGISTWAIDPVHSVVEFAVKHMMVATAKGVFHDFSGTLAIDEAHPERSSVSAAINVASIDTGNEQRDGHLRSDDFFNAERFPTATFTSTRVERDGDEYRITGDLTIRDVTRPVTLRTEFDGQVIDAYGKQRAAFTAQTSISRKEFGLKWDMPIETGGVVVGDRVKLTLHIAAVRQEA